MYIHYHLCGVIYMCVCVCVHICISVRCRIGLCLTLTGEELATTPSRRNTASSRLCPLVRMLMLTKVLNMFMYTNAARAAGVTRTLHITFSFSFPFPFLCLTGYDVAYLAKESSITLTAPIKKKQNQSQGTTTTTTKYY